MSVPAAGRSRPFPGADHGARRRAPDSYFSGLELIPIVDSAPAPGGTALAAKAWPRVIAVPDSPAAHPENPLGALFADPRGRRRRTRR